MEDQVKKASSSSERSRKWRKANKDRKREYQKIWRELNADHVAEYQKEYHEQYRLREDVQFNTWVRNLRRNYKMTPKDFNFLWEIQNGRCGICKIKMEPRGRGKISAVVDHCHTTEQVRGLLCRSCNTGIGHFSDNIDTLSSAIEYLKIRTEKVINHEQ